MTGKPRLIAFYLPQFHPIPENDAWWGKGFTEWTNTAKARPLFPGHYQPRIPADLGFYDLRVPETREEQARLAREAGVDAFCYWHYWFGNGKQLLEKPLQEVVKSGRPDFPFCLGWANASWYRKQWNPRVSRFSKELLIEQTYPGKADIEAHFYKMLPVFADRRYYQTVDGKLIFLIGDCVHVPDIDLFLDTWRDLAARNGLPPFFFLTYVSVPRGLGGSNIEKMDAVVLSALGSLNTTLTSRVRNKICGLLRLPLNTLSYRAAARQWNAVKEFGEERIYPALFPNWDHSPRMGAGGFILRGSTPELWKRHLSAMLDKVMKKAPENRIVFIKSWNEWAEGNYLEPDLRFGKRYIDALRKAVEENQHGRH